MKFHTALTSAMALTLVIFAALGSRASADHREVSLRATLSGLNEVPPTASRATATLRASLDESRQQMSFTLEYRNMTAPPTAAHIHFGQTKVNGGVIAFLCGGSTKPACPTTTSGRITGTIGPVDVVGPTDQGITAGDYAGLIYALRTGTAYANIHSSTFPNGELRGQISASGFSRDESVGKPEN